MYLHIIMYVVYVCMSEALNELAPQIIYLFIYLKEQMICCQRTTFISSSLNYYKFIIISRYWNE